MKGKIDFSTQSESEEDFIMVLSSQGPDSGSQFATKQKANVIVFYIQVIFKINLMLYTHKPKNALVKFEDNSRSIMKTAPLRPHGDIHRHVELTALWDDQRLKCTVLELHGRY